MSKYVPRHIREHTNFNFSSKDKVASYEDLFKEPDYEKDAAEHMERYYALEKQFEDKTSVTSRDLSFIVFASVIQTLRWYMISNDKFRFDKASDADEVFESIGEKIGIRPIEDIIVQSVPYDAIKRSERFKSIYPELSVGIAGANHRYTTLGHDPLIGLVVGTGNIATGTLCVNNWVMGFPSYHVVDNEIDGRTHIGKVLKWTYKCAVEQPTVFGVAFLKQLLHMGTDVFTKQGLPLPIINTISPETSKLLLGPNARIDVYSTVRAVALAKLINSMVAMLHRYFYNPSIDGNQRLYEARTMKVVMYSNVLASTLNIAYVAGTNDYTKSDIGGIAVALWELLKNSRKIQNIKHEFIDKCLSDYYKKEEDEVKAQLANYGYDV